MDERYDFDFESLDYDELLTLLLPPLVDVTCSLFEKAPMLEDSISLWAALDMAVTTAAEENIVRLGGDVERARRALDEYFLLHPPME